MNFEWILLALRLITTAILYTFLGLAFFIIWRDLSRTATPAHPAHRLRVLSPGDDPALAVDDRLPLHPVTLLGRDPAATVVIGDAAASTRHARLSWRGDGWQLEDLGSRNGTLLNDLPLTKAARLTPGDVIGIGGVRLEFESPDEAAE